MRTIAMPVGVSRPKLVKLLQNLASYVGVGLISTEDPDYRAIVDAHYAITLAYQHSDFLSVAKTLDRDFFMQRADGIKLNRGEVDDQIRQRFETQISTNYREEPAHMVIRGKTAKVASRVYSKTVCRRDGQLIELIEMAEHLTLWKKSLSGWKRVNTKIRHHEQNTEWIAEPVEVAEERKRTEKFLV